MGKQPHHLLEFIIMLEEKANKKLVYRHLKNCIYFKQKYSESEQEEILEKSDKLVLVASNPIQKNSDDNSKAFLSKNSIVNIRKNTIDCYCLRSLDEDQQKHLEQLILKATVENPEIKVLFEVIYPLLIKLPSRKQLNDQILKESIQKITKSTKEIVQNNKNRVTLAYDS
ncbi:1054_t:CDS:2 [Gigaspora margarita]|uniref:1054_t:CDS:1 n=1 Tax=Gigaspora margarita TaxID=4874 RepID=A0ABN7WSP2_GIGMA|nr:1054_t:CDS:2 [Gigaspora margarita]